jgi:hypothetical protein
MICQTILFPLNKNISIKHTLYVQGDGSLTGISLLIILLTALAGVLATYFWWKYTDHSH